MTIVVAPMIAGSEWISALTGGLPLISSTGIFRVMFGGARVTASSVLMGLAMMMPTGYSLPTLTNMAAPGTGRPEWIFLRQWAMGSTRRPLMTRMAISRP